MIIPMWEVTAGSASELVTSIIAPTAASSLELRVNIFSQTGGNTQVNGAIGHHRLGFQLATTSFTIVAPQQTIAPGNFASFTFSHVPASPIQAGDVLHLRLMNMNASNATWLLSGAVVQFVP